MINQLIKKLFFLLIGIFLSSIHLSAQNDAHYNASQFGLKGMLLSGALVAGNNDASMIYYNPAAIGYSKEKALDISLFVPNFELTKLKNTFGVEAKKGSFDFQMVPSLLSFKLSLIKNPKVGMAATVLYKNNFDNALLFNASQTTSNGFLSSDIQYSFQKREIWIGVGISYELNSHFSIGLSQFITFRRLFYDHQFSQTIVSEQGSTNIIALIENNFDTDLKAHFGLVNKFGIAYKSSVVNIGLTLTTPTYGYPIRKASYQFKTLYSALNSTNMNGTIYTRDKEELLLKTPFSIAGGIAFKINDIAVINLTAEYFGKIKDYNIIRKVGNNETFTTKEGAKQIVNVAIGWQINLNDKFSYLGGFRTDFNHGKTINNTTTQLYKSNWNIYHISNGLNFTYKKNKITIGIDYGFSFDKLDAPYVNLSEFNNANAGSDLSQKINYQSYTLLLTYGFLISNIKKDQNE